MERTAASDEQSPTVQCMVQSDIASTVCQPQQSLGLQISASGGSISVDDLLQQQLQFEQQPTLEAARPPTFTGSLYSFEQPQQPQQEQEQQQPPHLWITAWQDRGVNSGDGSGGSLGISNQFGAQTVPAELPPEMLSYPTASRAWEMEYTLPQCAEEIPLDVLGRHGQVGVLQRSASHQLTEVGQIHSSSMVMNPLTLPASPTMVQHQQQRQIQLLQHRQPDSALQRISPSSWPDTSMEQPLAPVPVSTPANIGDIGELLLWPGRSSESPGSSSLSLQQPGVLLSLQLRPTLQAAHQQQYLQQQQQQPLLAETSSGSQQQQGQQLHQSAVGNMAVPTMQPYHGVQATPEQLMPPPLPLWGTAAASASAAATAGGPSGPRPPPLVIPHTQQQQHLPQTQQQFMLAPTPSPAAAASNTSVTPAMLSMGLADTPRTDSSAVAGIFEQESASGAGRVRRARRRPSVSSSPTVPGSCNPHSAAPVALVGAAALLRAGRRYFQVVCGSLTGWLDVDSMLVQVQGGGQHDSLVTPAAFEALAGKGSTRKWRQSLTVLPLNANDPFVTEPTTLGDFMKQYYLERPSSAACQLGRVSSSSIGGLEDSLVSPGRSNTLVSPGARRRRQSQSTTQESAEGATSATAVAADQPLLSAKRSRGASGEPAAQQRLQPQPPPLQTLQEHAPHWAWHSAAAAGAAAEQAMSTLALVQQQPHLAQPSDVWHTAAAANQRAVAQQMVIPRSLSAQSMRDLSQQPLLQHEQLQQQPLQVTEPHMQQQVFPGQIQWRPYSPPLLGAQAGVHAAADAAAASRPVIATTSQGEQSARPHATTSAQADVQQQCSQRQQHVTAVAQKPSPASRESRGRQSGALAADVPSKVAGTSVSQLVSSSGRPIRQPVTSKGALAAAAAHEYEQGSQPVRYKGGIQHLEVWCDQLRGVLDLHKMQVVPQEGKCEGQPMSLSAFEQLGGRGTARKWRRSLTTTDGTEMVSLGEWFERYQILPVTQYATHLKSQAKAGARPRALTPPAVQTAARHNANATYSARQDRDQQAAMSPQQRRSAKAVHPGALSTLAAEQLQQPQHELHQQFRDVISGQEAPLATVHHSGSHSLPVDQGNWQLEIEDSEAKPTKYVLSQDTKVTSGPDDTRRPSLDTRHTGVSASADPVLGMPMAAGDQLNSDLLLMLTDYASDYNHPEFELLPSQVEQDMADLSTLVEGAVGVPSPKLAQSG